MKKTLTIGLLIVAVLAIICVMIFFVFRNPIPLIDGLRFDMSPKQVQRILGAHEHMEHNYCATLKDEYTYKTDVLGSPATVSCRYLNNKLTDLDIRWDTPSPDLKKKAYDCIYELYHSDEYFYERQDSLGIDNGATGIFYNITETDTSLIITCMNLS